MIFFPETSSQRKGRALLFFLVAIAGVTLAANQAVAEQEGGTGRNAPAPGRLEGGISTPDGHEVPGVRLALVERNSGIEHRTFSDGEGRFRFSDLPAGTYEISAEMEGFTPLKQLIEVKAGETTWLGLTLVLLPVTEKITVTTTRTEQRLGDLPVQVSVLTRDDIRQAAAWAVDDLLKQFPSFSLFRRTSSMVSHPTTQGVSLRGIGASGTSRTLVLLDGVPLNDSFGNWVYWSKIPQARIKTIEMAEGSLSTLYGSSAMAGVINVVTQRPQPRTIAIVGEGGTHGTGNLDIGGSHTFGRVGVAIDGRVFRTGGYNLVREEERGAIDTPAASRDASMHWTLEYLPTSKVQFFQNGRFFGEHRANGTPLQDNSTRETYLGAGLRAQTSASSDLQANLFAHLQTFRSSFSSVAPNRTSETLALLQKVPSKDLGANAQWSWRPGHGHRLTVGGDTWWIQADDTEEVFASTAVKTVDRLITGQQLYAGVFFQDFITPTARLVLVVGFRVDSWRNFGATRSEIRNPTGTTTFTAFLDRWKSTVTPQTGILFRLRHDLALRAAFYQGFRAPTLNELYRPFRVGNVQTNANENLGPERLTGGEAGFNYSITPKLFWRTTGYWDQLKDPISNVTLTVTPNLITRQRQNIGQARVRGLDTQIEYRIRPQWRWTGYYLFNGATIEDFPPEPALVGKRIPQVPKHRVSLAIDYLNPARVTISLSERFESFRFDDDLNQFRLGSYFVTDLSILRPLGEFAELLFSVENLFNRQYAVQATPVELLGTPVLVRGGIRFNFRGR